LSAAAIALLLRGALRRFALDHPNERSLHTAPVPRTGGLGIMAGVTGGFLLLGVPHWPVLAGALALAGISLADDLRGLPVPVRFAGHLAVAAAFVALHWSALPHPLWAPVAVLALGWMTNLYNFMDGSDGLAGGMALLGFGCYALAAALAGQAALAGVSAVAAAAAAGFLAYNFPPARIFMGDAGSVPLGFMAGALGLAGWTAGAWAPWFPVLVFSPFIVDATVTLLRRALRRERVWQAHREHYYQRMVQLGLGHRGTALVWYGLMLAVGASAVLGLRAAPPAQAALLAAWLAVYAVLMVLVDRRWTARGAGSG
jgi:UDP-N-acetylmuramyl pentapeptide phosphotransferase/UDP-N-acetylglucosamine-1-phosphate transferase